MQAVITMAGRGERFIKKGYNVPKYIINIGNKTMFEYSIQSLPLSLIEKYIFVILREHQEKFNVIGFINDKMLSYGIDKNKYIIIPIESVTRGQAETALLTKEYLDPAKDLIIYNIDTYFKSTSLEKKLKNTELKKDGIIGAFYLDRYDNKWSFARCDNDGYVVETAEKNVISNYALTGFYHFTLAQDFIEAAEEMIRRNDLTKGEFYVAPVYNYLIKKGKKFVIDLAEKIIPLGTPEDVERAKNELL
jgi:dTDP-glucose pyrophosphorylase